MATTKPDDAAVLVAPERNHYFYGKLLDVDQLSKEQRYFLRHRRLLNRLVLGSGVVCGMDLVPDTGETLVIQPGLAIDGLGREIVVPEKVAVDPRQLTDDEGRPAGEPLETGTVEICLAYAEVPTDPQPALVPACDRSAPCAASTIREGFAVRVREAPGAAPASPSCGLGPLPLDPEALYQVLCQHLTEACPEVPSDPCVALGVVSFNASGSQLLPCAGRRLIFSNRLVHELVLCFTQQLASAQSAARAPTLRAAAGEQQLGTPGRRLPRLLKVELVDPQDKPLPGRLVQFEVTRGLGSLGSGDDPKVTEETVRTDKRGIAAVRWTLGAAAKGPQEVTARAVGTSSEAVFHAVIAKQ